MKNAHRLSRFVLPLLAVNGLGVFAFKPKTNRGTGPVTSPTNISRKRWY
jgi:hypothetical protein